MNATPIPKPKLIVDGKEVSPDSLEVFNVPEDWTKFIVWATTWSKNGDADLRERLVSTGLETLKNDLKSFVLQPPVELLERLVMGREGGKP